MVAQGTAIVAVAIPAFALAYLGLFSRFLADDYCAAGKLASLGFFPAQAYWYQEWTGRYSFILIMQLALRAGIKLTPYLPMAVLVLWIVALALLAREALATRRVRHGALSRVLLAGTALLATASGAPDGYQSLLWQTGLLTYSFPLVLLTGYLAWLVLKVHSDQSRRPGVLALGLGGLAAFFVGGFSETIAAVQAGLLIAGLLGSGYALRGATRERARRLIGFGLVGSLLGMAVMVLAPGNQVRLGSMPALPSVSAVVGLTLRHSLAFTAKAVANAPLALLLVLIVPALTAAHYARPVEGLGERGSDLPSVARKWLRFVVAPAVTYGLIAASIAPAVMATGAYPAERSLITGQYVLVLGAGAWGYQWGSHLARHPISSKYAHLTPGAWGLVALLALMTAIGLTSRTLAQAPDVRDFAGMWEVRNTRLENAGASTRAEIAVASLPHIGGLAEITDDPDFWVNRCVAEMYGLRSVRAK